jgi:hypothetical protein
MRKKHSSALIIGLLCIALLAGCKKKHDKSRSELLVGSWKITQSIIDSNKNGVIDANEYKNESDSNSIMMVFGADGSIRISKVLPPNLPETGTWKLINNDADLLRTRDIANDTFIMHIESLTDTKVIFPAGYLGQGTPDSFKLWTVFTKL